MSQDDWKAEERARDKKRSPDEVKSKARDRAKRRYDADPEKASFDLRRRLYGISREQYREMEVSQGGACAICRAPQFMGSMHVDHCHKTKKVRGLLCSRCNPAIGLLQDDPVILRAAAAYLESRKT